MKTSKVCESNEILVCVNNHCECLTVYTTNLMLDVVPNILLMSAMVISVKLLKDIK